MKKSAGLLLSFFFVLLVFSGCMEKEENDLSANVISQQKQTLKIGYLPITDHLPLMVAKGQKSFEDVEVEAIKFSDWPTLVESLKSGSVDGAHMLNTLAIKMVADGFDAQAVLLSHRGGMALETIYEIESVEDLKGKKIGVPSRFSPHYLALHYYLSTNGIDPEKEVTIIDAAPPELVSMLSTGAIQAFVVAEPFPTISESKGIGKTFKLWDEIQIEGTNGMDCVIIFGKEIIDNQPKAIQAYVDTMVKTGNELKSNESHLQKSAQLASPFMLSVDPEIIIQSINRPEHRCTYDDLYPKYDEFEKFHEYMLQIDLLETPIQLEPFVNTRFAKSAYEKHKSTLGE